jgi:peptide/nickel transport system permease protein/oligopeptide transport system permease protein
MLRRVLTRRRGIVAGGALLCLLAAAAWLGPVLVRHDPLEIAAGGGLTLERPTAAHPFGTDALGRDLLARVLWAGRVSLAVGVGVELLVATLGCVVGVVAGYYGGVLDGVLMRTTDVVMAFPSLVLAIGLIAVFERPGLDKVVLVLVALGWTTIARVVRGAVLTLKEHEYVQAAQALGAGNRAIILRHLLPNALGPLLVAATLGVGSNMIAEAGLSFLGLGAQPPSPEWGAMLSNGRNYVLIAPHLVLYPGLALLLLVLGLNLFQDGLRLALDPRLTDR